MDRRAVLTSVSAAGVIASGAASLAVWAYRGKSDWTEATTVLRHTIDRTPFGQAALLELVRCATLAPNSHNSQPWHFALGTDEIRIIPDFSRRMTVVDPDDHHLYVSLGAAAENIVQAAPMLGLIATTSYEPDGDGAIRLTMRPGDGAGSPLAAAIFQRQSTRSLYDGRALPAADLLALVEASRGPDRDGPAPLIVTGRSAMADISDLIVAANTQQMNNPMFIDELKNWLRFSYADALATRDGLFAVTTGNPALPTGLGRAMFDLVVSPASEAHKYQDQIASSAGLAIFVSRIDDRAHWVAAGRAFQRFALQATALGIKYAVVNQAVEVPIIRQRLAAHLRRDGHRPDLVVRFGYGLEMPWSMRRAVADVLA